MNNNHTITDLKLRYFVATRGVDGKALDEPIVVRMTRTDALHMLGRGARLQPVEF